MSKKISFVVPIYNEAETLPELKKRMDSLLLKITDEVEIIFINDGSKDSSQKILSDFSAQDPKIKVINFSRNFGHQIAITAGMDFARGDAVIIMDADLQDPPETVLELLAKWKEGFDVVYAVRKSREGESWLKKLTASLYYRLLKRISNLDIPLDTGDFRLVDRKVLDAFLTLRESNRFVRGMFSWVGFKQIGIEFERTERFAGETKYPLSKMMKLAFDGMVSFTFSPLQFVLKLGLVIASISLLLIFYGIYRNFTGNTIVGWTSLFVLVSFFGGVNLAVLGMLGEYIGRIHDEVKRRPLYIVESLAGFPKTKNEI